MRFREGLLLGLFVMVIAVGSAFASESSDAKGNFVRLTGAGASFPAPLYNKWFKDYHALHQNVQVDYQSVGSGSGIKNFINKTVDFGAK